MSLSRRQIAMQGLATGSRRLLKAVQGLLDDEEKSPEEQIGLLIRYADRKKRRDRDDDVLLALGII